MTRFRQIARYDLTLGIASNAVKYILTVTLFAIVCLMFFLEIRSFYGSGRDVSKASLMDCLLHIFKGMDVYEPSPENPFEIPVIWLLIQVLIAFFVLGYPTQDIHAYGIQILMRTKNRSLWWLSKCLWNVATVASVYAVGFLVVVAATSVAGRMSLVPTPPVNAFFDELMTEGVDVGKLCFAVFALPLLTSIALSLLQMMLSFVLSPIYGYMIAVCLLVASAYFYSPILIGNHSMLARNALFYADGLGSAGGVLASVVTGALSVAIGMLYFKRYDILKKG